MLMDSILILILVILVLLLLLERAHLRNRLAEIEVELKIKKMNDRPVFRNKEKAKKKEINQVGAWMK